MASSDSRAVIFDIDGTLTDSVDLHAKAWRDAFRAFGVNADFFSVRREIGRGGDQLLPIFLSPTEISAFGEEIKNYRSMVFARRYLIQILSLPGVRALFLALKARGLSLALGTSAKGDELDIYKNIAGIADLVDVEVSADDVERSKPFPDVFEMALKRLGLSQNAGFVVGDTPHDAEAATNAGLASIGFLSGGRTDAELRAAGCMEIYRNPADLLSSLDNSIIARGAGREKPDQAP
jgi:HAD superfamily hydrolase (TIGR01509 family)